MKPVPAAVWRASVAKKGFVDTQSRKHERWNLVVDGRKTTWNVKLSHGVSELSIGELTLNARQIGVPANELHRVLCCEYDLQETVELYRRCSAGQPPATVAAQPPERERLQQRLNELKERLEAVPENAPKDELDRLIAEYEEVRRRLFGT